MPIITESNRHLRDIQRFYTEHYGITAPLHIFERAERMFDAGCSKLDIAEVLMSNAEPFEPTQQ